MNSQSLSQIRYRPLDRLKSEIRLIKVQPRRRSDRGSLLKCVSIHVSLDWYRERHPLDESLPRWLALSYAWGDEAPSSLIKLDGVRVRVSRNLGAALEEYGASQADEFPYLWADAICINQRDEEEKSW